MADSGVRPPGPGQKLMPQNLFATWEIDKSAPNCIPRVCSLKLSRLLVPKPLEQDLMSVIIAVKMESGSQSSKRTLRSTEISLQGGIVDSELDITFIMQYPHFLKRDGNKLQIMLQRRKKYKNRPILGYKTLALGQVSMAQVLQCSKDRELRLYSDNKDNKEVARITILSLSSQPVDHDEIGRRKMQDSTEADRSPDVDNDSEEDEPHFHDSSSNDEISDSEVVDDERRTRPRKGSRGIRPSASRQRNLKQKIIALLRRFRVSEEVLDSEQDPELVDQEQNQQDIEALFDELEDLSDSGPEMDTLSVLSTPKPSLRPFFTARSQSHDVFESKDSASMLSDDSSKRNDSDGHGDASDREQQTRDPPQPNPDHDSNKSRVSTESNKSDPVGQVSKVQGEDRKLTELPRSPQSRPKLSRDRSISFKEKKARKETKPLERRSSVGNSDNLPRKVLLEQLGYVLKSDDLLPDNVILVNACDAQGQLFSHKLQEKNHRVICTCSNADVKATMQFLVNKIQKFCNSNSRSPFPIKIALAGNDAYINSILKPWVEQFSAKPPDWQGYVKFLIIPLGASQIAKYLGSIDSIYQSIFCDSSWKEAFERSETQSSHACITDFNEIINRVSRYLKGATAVSALPIAEAMVTCKGKRHSLRPGYSNEDESSQIFVPFISDVRIGPIPSEPLLTLPTEPEDVSVTPSSTQLSSSPPQTIDSHTPPNSPSVTSINSPPPTSQPSVSTSFEFLELQLDYWSSPAKTDTGEKEPKDSKKDKKDSNKSSLKTAFKSIQVSRLPPPGELPGNTMSLTVVTKEKKQKIMRIGKKSKEAPESKSQDITGVSRLICTSKSERNMLTVTIDGQEWTGVKFFQVSNQWQTQIKQFPVAVFGHTETAC